MHTAYKTPALTIAGRPTAEIDADLLVIPFFTDDDLADEPDLDRASGGELTRARGRGECSGKLYELFVTTTALAGWKSPRAVFIGAGPLGDFTPDHLRRIAIVGGLAARQRRVTRVSVLYRPGTAVTPLVAAQVIAEGVVLANYDGASWRTAGPPATWLESAGIRITGAPLVSGGCRARPDSRGMHEPGARSLQRAGKRADAARVRRSRDSDCLFVRARRGSAGRTQITQLEMGMLLGVARGSQEPPRLVVLRHEPPRAESDVVLGLVGKGITFDTGGISIKPADNMDKMKDDMSGGAAVICAMAAIARLNVPVRCIGIVPMTENMPGGRAVKPGDILTSAAGKTVEIINTDAEGRLVLGDGLWYARQRGATHLVDVATLTGACVVALGKTTSGLFGTPSAWVEHVRRASERAGDRSWPMPVFDDYKEQLKSEIADFTNTGGRPGGAITAALFIKEFAGDLPWVHMDIAGTAWAEEAKPYQPKGATGVGVRTLVELARDAAAWSTPDSVR
jgi:leucyl aminopeptidase